MFDKQEDLFKGNAILTITLTVYTGLAYFVSMGVSGNMWANSPPGSLFPIPLPAGGSFTSVFSEMSLVDEFIYIVFINFLHNKFQHN